MLRFATWKILSVLILPLVALLLVVPSLLPKGVQQELAAVMPKWSPLRPIVLGLDLQGGAHMLLEVDQKDLVKRLATQLRDDVRRVLREQKVPISGGIGFIDKGVQVRIADAAARAKVMPPLQALSQPVGNGAGAFAGNSLDVTETPDGLIKILLSDADINERVRRAVDQSIEVIRKRVDALGTTEPNIQREGADRIVVEVPGLKDVNKLYEILGTTAKLTFQLVADPNEPADEVETLPYSEDGRESGTLKVQKRIMVDGADLTGAQPGVDQDGNTVVNFSFNFRGGQRFGDVTRENVGKPFAIVLDGKVISAPTIRSPITGGQGQISGKYTYETANNLAILLRSGALPAKLTIGEVRTIGPGLGQDAIDAGKRAFYVAAALVLTYMLFTYGIFGVFADVALVIHILLIFAAMVLLGATLTLPGIAGIVLTIGMAVDANVLIYERIREEAHMGRSVVSSLDAGFKRAFATIVDSNVTMFVAAVILWMAGSGPVKGFAISLGLGILTSIVTAVTMTRMMIAVWYRAQRPKTIPI